MNTWQATDSFSDSFDIGCAGLQSLDQLRQLLSEARWRKSPTDVPPLTSLQDALLDSAASSLRPGGLLAYVTCSPHRAETRTVANSMLKNHPEITEISAREVLHSLAPEPVDLGGDELSVQLWPHRHGTDAMFIALFEKSAKAARARRAGPPEKFLFRSAAFRSKNRGTEQKLSAGGAGGGRDPGRPNPRVGWVL